ncbi:MAG: hypothetical protein RSE36_05685 [Oscillospiraceae bacterium]
MKKCSQGTDECGICGICILKKDNLRLLRAKIYVDALVNEERKAQKLEKLIKNEK